MVGEWWASGDPPYSIPMDEGTLDLGPWTLDLGPPELSNSLALQFRIENSELRILLNGEFSQRGPEGGGERGSSPKPIAGPGRGRVENPVSSGFLEGSGARGPARARRGLTHPWTSLDFSQPLATLQPFRELGRDFSGGTGKVEKKRSTFSEPDRLGGL